MPIDRAAIRARVRKAIDADLAKGDTPGHDFHGNQYSGGQGTEKQSDMRRVGHLTFEKTGSKWIANGNLGKWSIEKTAKSYTVYLRGNGSGWTRPDGSRYFSPKYLRRETISRTFSEASETARRRDDTTGMTSITKHARPDHHVDQERSPRGTFGGHRSTAQSDDANSFMGTPNPDSATDMESSYGYHGPSASEEEAVAEAILTEAGNDGETGELQGDFESGQQGIPQPTLWGLLSLSNRRSVKPVDGEPNIFDDVTRYINTVQGQPDTVLIDPGVTPKEKAG